MASRGTPIEHLPWVILEVGWNRTARALLILLLTFLSVGCGDRAANPASRSSSKLPFAGQKLNVFNWSDYIDSDLIPEFQQRTGATVQYVNYSSESELETKLL